MRSLTRYRHGLGRLVLPVLPDQAPKYWGPPQCSKERQVRRNPFRLTLVLNEMLKLLALIQRRFQ